jgi:uncharacterized integral membrane protein
VITMTEQRGSDQPDLARKRTDNPDTDRLTVQSPPTSGRPEQAGPPPSASAPATSTAPASEAASEAHRGYQKVRRTKFSGLWVGITVAAIVLLALLVFIIENSQTVDIGFFGAHWHASLGVAMLLAAICGILLVAIPGYGRIIQLRRVLRKAARPGVDRPNPK